MNLLLCGAATKIFLIYGVHNINFTTKDGFLVGTHLVLRIFVDPPPFALVHSKLTIKSYIMPIARDYTIKRILFVCVAVCRHEDDTWFDGEFGVNQCKSRRIHECPCFWTMFLYHSGTKKMWLSDLFLWWNLRLLTWYIIWWGVCDDPRQRSRGSIGICTLGPSFCAVKWWSHDFCVAISGHGCDMWLMLSLKWPNAKTLKSPLGSVIQNIFAPYWHMVDPWFLWCNLWP